jgi:hypothetical protein
MVKRVTGPSEDAEIDRRSKRTIRFLLVMVALLFLASALLVLSNK